MVRGLRSRFVSRSLGIVVIVLLALTSLTRGLGHANAQTDGAGPAGRPPVGTAVSIIGTEGTELATITVTKVEDPFENYQTASPPQRGFRYVLVSIEAENTGPRPFNIDSGWIYLQDDEGFVSPRIFINRLPDDATARPDLPGGEMAPGEVRSGVVGFQVLAESEIARVIFWPSSDRLIFLADLGVPGIPMDEDATPVGSPVVTVNATGDVACGAIETWATATGDRIDQVSAIVDELQDMDRETADPDRLTEIAGEFTTMAADQGATPVPAGLDDANAQFVEAYASFADLFDGAATAVRDGDVDSFADDPAIIAQLAAANATLQSAGNASRPIVESCGL